jgi:hypothetical protein
LLKKRKKKKEEKVVVSKILGVSSMEGGKEVGYFLGVYLQCKKVE